MSGKNTKKSDPSKLSFDISKAQSKFTKGFSKADTLGPCPFPGDAADIKPAVDDCVSEVIDLINFGTITTTTTTATIPTTTTTTTTTSTTAAPTTTTSTTCTIPTTTTTLVLCGNGVLGIRAVYVKASAPVAS